MDSSKQINIGTRNYIDSECEIAIECAPISRIVMIFTNQHKINSTQCIMQELYKIVFVGG